MAEKRWTRRSAKTKAKAVGIALVEGVTAAEEKTGIPKSSIHLWLRDERFAPLRTRARAEVAEDFWTAVQVALHEVTAGLQDPDVPLRDKAQALHELGDRFALLTGAATERTETRDIGDRLAPEQRDKLMDDIDVWLEGQKA